MTLVEYLNEVNGNPWTSEDHCWRFVGEVQARFFGRVVPEVTFPERARDRHALLASHPVRREWRQVDGPEHGAIVLMAKLRNIRIDEHAGVCVFLPHPIIAHTDFPQGVAVEDVPMVMARGWSPQFYMPVTP